MPINSRHPWDFNILTYFHPFLQPLVQKKKQQIPFSSSLPTYPWRLVPGEHPPGVPVHVLSEGGVLIFPKSVDVLGWQAGGNLDEHVAEGEGAQV